MTTTIIKFMEPTKEQKAERKSVVKMARQLADSLAPKPLHLENTSNLIKMRIVSGARYRSRAHLRMSESHQRILTELRKRKVIQ
jgi:hypothetical protein